MPKSTTQKSFNQILINATRLTGVGKLMNATRLIQRALLSATPATQTRSQPDTRREPAQAANDPQTREVPPQVIILPPPASSTLPNSPTAFKPPQADSVPAAPRRKASFTKHQFVFEGDPYPYRLYIPPSPVSDADAALLPLVVLLHGCKQDALDFSHGTAMNDLAETHQAMVLYPEQITSGNAMRCWNWFDPSHQQAGRGEPGMIAALTRKMIAQQGADPDRIYVAGLSAGGAMAAVVANLYPHLFAAVGVHSGLAAGAAQSMMQAFSAMQEGAKGNHTTALPTIVFHGTADQTVNPSNGVHVTQAAIAAFKSEGLELVKSKAEVHPRADQPTERTTYSDANGKPFVESWRITAGPHAWSGGKAHGSFTDPDGPDASAAMLAFFLQHHKGESKH